MDQPTCCEKAKWVSVLDLGQAGGFEFILGRCKHCRTNWMNVFCGASGVSGYEPVGLQDVERMKSIASGPELKGFMRAWGDTHL